MIRQVLLTLAVTLAISVPAQADPSRNPADVLRQVIDSVDSPYLTQSEQNLMMMEDNPNLWTVDEGKELFHAKRGPKNASLESCDFGKGRGVLKGAYAEMPRYFKDTDKVMDLETRLVHCMTTIQGFAADDPAVRQRHNSDSDHMKLQSYIAAQSNNMPWNPPLKHPMEKAMRDAGEVIFYRRSGSLDMSCQTCHTATGKRIRASVLPNVNVPEEWTKAISWPAFRVGHQHSRSSQHRIRGCYWQMRQAGPVAGSPATIALMSYWTDMARGQPAILPDMKR
jgi:sulfur-oxidizing protein SoxA